MKATPGMPFRQAVARRQERVRHIMHMLPENAQIAIQESLEASGLDEGYLTDVDQFTYGTAIYERGVAQ